MTSESIATLLAHVACTTRYEIRFKVIRPNVIRSMPSFTHKQRLQQSLLRLLCHVDQPHRVCPGKLSFIRQGARTHYARQQLALIQNGLLKVGEIALVDVGIDAKVVLTLLLARCLCIRLLAANAVRIADVAVAGHAGCW